MGALEIILIIAGAMIFIISFIMPEMGSELEQVDPQITKKQISDMIEKELKDVKEQVSEIVDETSTYSVEKTERALERLTNEKITAVSEFSETVLEDIHKSHEEVMFLYDMLNTKHEDLKEEASKVSASVKAAREAREELETASEQAVDTLSAKETEAAKEEEEKESAAEVEWMDFHSEQARAFFEEQEQQNTPTIDEIRASFQPMNFKEVSAEDEEGGRIFGGDPEQEEEISGKLPEEDSDADLPLAESGIEEVEPDEAETMLREKEQLSEDEEQEAVIDEILGVGVSVSDQEAAMDAALAALTGESIALENANAFTSKADTAIENAKAAQMSASTAAQNSRAASEKAGTAVENEKAIGSSLMGTAVENIKASGEKADTAIENENASKKVSKPKKSKAADAGTKKGIPGQITLPFAMDNKGGMNHNERILELHKKGKSNIAIAKELGLGVGEVKLVLDLFKDM